MCNLFWHIGLFFKLYAASLLVSVKNLHLNDHNCWTSHCPFVEHPQVDHYISQLNTPILNPSLPHSLISGHLFHNEGHWIELFWTAILGFFQLLNVLHSLVDAILAGVAEAQITCLVLIWTSSYFIHKQNFWNWIMIRYCKESVFQGTAECWQGDFQSNDYLIGWLLHVSTSPVTGNSLLVWLVPA